MTSIFIVRPFGKKRVAITEGQSVEIDFDAIDQAQLAISASTCSRC